MRIGAVTDVGKQRKLNEDSYFVYRNENLLGGMVADGMGGQNAGEVASAMATQIVKEHIINEFNPDMDYVEMGEMIRQAFLEANSRIYKYAKTDKSLEGMGTTATLAIIYRDKIIAAHVGDSRAYLIDGDDIHQITKDHSYVQELLSRGEITKEFADRHPAKNYITRAVGAEDILKVDVTILEYHGETVLLCSDGLTNMLCDSQLIELINENENLQTGAEALVRLANKKGGLDNITAVVFGR
jgi:serine/threonine protein phosphatase PrpC